MHNEVAQIEHIQSLYNGSCQLTLSIPSNTQHPLPGHLILLEQSLPAYLINAQNNLYEVLVSQPYIHLNKKTLWVSPLQGTPLAPPHPEKFTLLLVENEALSACIFYFRLYRHAFRGLAIIGTETDFPFKPCPSKRLIDGLPHEVIGAIPLLDDWGVPHCLASLKDTPGCFQGTTPELASFWLNNNPALQPEIVRLPRLKQ